MALRCRLGATCRKLRDSSAKGLGVRGIVAVEFAICAPFLMLLMFGTIEMLMLYRTEAKLNIFAGNFAQMVALQEITTISSTTGATSTHSPVPVTGTSTKPGLTDLCAGAVYGLQPFPPNGLTVDVASVTKIATTGTVPYDEWEVDLGPSCNAVGGQLIGTTAALALATGNGSSTALVQGLGDNAIIVKATLQYPGLLGLFLTSAQTLAQTAVARWRYASTTNITNTTPAPPSSSLEFYCTGSGCVSNNGV